LLIAFPLVLVAAVTGRVHLSGNYHKRLWLQEGKLRACIPTNKDGAGVRVFFLIGGKAADLSGGKSAYQFDERRKPCRSERRKVRLSV
jgi:hypothetical protein